MRVEHLHGMRIMRRPRQTAAAGPSAALAAAAVAVALTASHAAASGSTVPHGTATGLPLGLRHQYQPLAHQMRVEHLHGMRIMRR